MPDTSGTFTGACPFDTTIVSWASGATRAGGPGTTLITASRGNWSLNARDALVEKPVASSCCFAVFHGFPTICGTGTLPGPDEICSRTARADVHEPASGDWPMTTFSGSGEATRDTVTEIPPLRA